MKIVWLATILLPLVTAIAPFPAMAQTTPEMLSFQCAEGHSFKVTLKPREANVQFDTGEKMTLLYVDSREGRKFANLNTLLAIQDNQAYIEQRFVKVLTQCMASTPTANSNN